MMFAPSGVALAVPIFVVWTAAACALVSRASRRVTGTSAVSWISVAGAAVSGMLAICCARSFAQVLIGGIACISLAVAADADARTGYLFDAITIPSAALVLAVAVAAGSADSAFAGATLLVAIFGSIVACSRGRAMGLGDVKALATIGAAFGPVEAAFAVAAACASGIVEAVIRGRLRHAEIRFGPHLAVGSACALVFGERFFSYVTGG